METGVSWSPKIVASSSSDEVRDMVGASIELHCWTAASSMSSQHWRVWSWEEWWPVGGGRENSKHSVSVSLSSSVEDSLSSMTAPPKAVVFLVAILDDFRSTVSSPSIWSPSSSSLEKLSLDDSRSDESLSGDRPTPPSSVPILSPPSSLLSSSSSSSS